LHPLLAQIIVSYFFSLVWIIGASLITSPTREGWFLPIHSFDHSAYIFNNSVFMTNTPYTATPRSLPTIN
jgi:hypothetical protein